MFVIEFSGTTSSSWVQSQRATSLLNIQFWLVHIGVIWLIDTNIKYIMRFHGILNRIPWSRLIRRTSHSLPSAQHKGLVVREKALLMDLHDALFKLSFQKVSKSLCIKEHIHTNLGFARCLKRQHSPNQWYVYYMCCGRIQCWKIYIY